MTMIKKITLMLLLAALKLSAQERPIKVVTKDIPKRLAFYAVNENEQDFDVMITITGTNFRQSKGRPRWIRLPAASKVHLKTIILNRGKRPNYSYDLAVNDSLSKRAIKVEAERIKIKPRKSITVYITEGCTICDSIVQPLEQSNYLFQALRLRERPEVKEQLKNSFSMPLDSITQPIVNLGGRLYTTIENYGQLLEIMNKE